MEYLFVYGTLRRGTTHRAESRKSDGTLYARFLEQFATYIGEAKTDGRIHLIKDYPGFVDGKGIVVGDLYTVSTKVLKTMDEYEGKEFERLKRDVEGPAGVVDSWIYVYAYNVTGKERIQSGDWVAHLANPS